MTKDDWKRPMETLTKAIGACACLGPQNGEPLCPCKMRGISDKVWNAAIEAAACEVDGGWNAEAIRKLKK